MTRIIEMAREREREADMLESAMFGRGEGVNDNVEVVDGGVEVAGDRGVDSTARDVADALYQAIDATKLNTGQDISGGSVEDLSGNIAGQVEVATRRMSLDDAVAESGDAEVIAHVGTHEGTHLQNISKAGGVRVQDFRFEEALTETATSFVDGGRIMAYREYMHILAEVTAATGVGRRELVRMYQDGENEELNELYERTYGGVEFREAA